MYTMPNEEFIKQSTNISSHIKKHFVVLFDSKATIQFNKTSLRISCNLDSTSIADLIYDLNQSRCDYLITTNLFSAVMEIDIYYAELHNFFSMMCFPMGDPQELLSFLKNANNCATSVNSSDDHNNLFKPHSDFTDSNKTSSKSDSTNSNETPRKSDSSNSSETSSKAYSSQSSEEASGYTDFKKILVALGKDDFTNSRESSIEFTYFDEANDTDSLDAADRADRSANSSRSRAGSNADSSPLLIHSIHRKKEDLNKEIGTKPSLEFNRLGIRFMR